MWTLIGRELRDHAPHIVLAGFVSTFTIIIAAVVATWGMTEVWQGIAAAMMPLLFAVFCMLGTSQMYTDRANRVSALLATSAVTRNGILAARVLSGALVILATLVPILITILVILWMIGSPLSLRWGAIVEVFTTAVLASFACYCAGLLSGWTANRVIPVLGIFFGVLLLLLLVVVKGMGIAAILLLVLFSVACLSNVWHRYTSVSL
ncbi:MAG: hypothetical protein JW955_24350 [Sedimentisphaerales bacterium]|nr:hypothetical protein [Sedimentisphaerales bacterium]